MTTARSRSKRIGLRDRLGQLTYRAACRLMGDKDGEARLHQGAGFEIDVARDVYLSGDTLRVNVPDIGMAGQRAIVTIVEMINRPKGLYMQCDRCETRCNHIAAALSMVLEAKGPLGLSAPPDPSEPIELLTEEELLRRALADRQERAAKEKMTLRALTPDRPWSDYTITSHESGKTYRVALRGFEAGESYCSCPDFRTNHLGTCKHILHAQAKLHARFSKKQLATPYRRKGISLRLDYGHVLGLRFNLPSKSTDELMQLLGSLAHQTVEDVPQLMTTLRALEKAGYAVHVYPDAEEFINQRLLQHGLVMAANEIRSDPARHALRNSLLRVELLPYQLDGIAFAVGAGRAVLADDMGLGKTIQGIGVAELLARLADIRRVLVVCPASLKSQWRNEINRFADRSSQIILGNAEERLKRYHGDAFFTICNYEQVIRDCTAIEGVPWDLIILDEGQRIKNWQTKTSQVIKSLKSRFALVLSGPPLENRLGELYTVVTFIDDRRLGPIHRFLHQHRVVDERGRVEGYRNLDLLRHQLKPVLLRRTRASVMQQLPERSTEVVRIRPTDEQRSMSDEYLKLVSMIVRKPYLTELDLLRIQKYLLLARMAADSSFLVDKKRPGYSSKLERITELLEQLAAGSDRKILIFSEWTTMLGLIEPILKRTGLPFIRLDGQVPQGKRQQIVHEFQHNAACKVLLMSNAGNTGLNLQAANTVINVDLP